MGDLQGFIDNPAGTTSAVPVTQPLDTSTVKLTANLSEDKVAVQHRSIARLKADPGGFVNRYRMEFGDHFNPDNAAELFPDYCSSPENRAKYRTAVAGAAGWVSDEAFRQRLAEPDEMPIFFTAGGTGSGKSTIAGPAGYRHREAIFEKSTPASLAVCYAFVGTTTVFGVCTVSIKPLSRAIRPTLLRLRSAIAARNSSPDFRHHEIPASWIGARACRRRRSISTPMSESR